ncbi:hypothetical protein ASPVEDRAFT_26931 [Aspergillus versicolor CBS 583.65]|uniref:Transcription factor domain-containing protein n=1 Tax=Aspergillus versicolor CBS 583.65 TaxID=1036611 RepID=A0A1L9PFF1_ASPVE|nr:uncharacterized protein ASPVEDRAFT_26931 [Aspergillus versicolor CBS 583.65]OJJ00175.1 hypothetical protein ASPVEDRAFT_26931 [Aspergillus versicolor CBS 583.65]
MSLYLRALHTWDEGKIRKHGSIRPISLRQKSRIETYWGANASFHCFSWTSKRVKLKLTPQESAINALLDVDPVLQRPLSLQSEHSLVAPQDGFDYCDPRKHFRNHVANAATTDRTLLYAIFAVSARYQSASSRRLSIFAEECQQSCLNSLISALNDYDTTVGENVFASALILRLIEEMTGPYGLQLPVPHPGVDTVSHTLSAQLLICIRAGNITTSLITDAAFIIILRQEIFVANLTQRPVGSITEHCNIYTSLNPASEPMWAYRAIALAARSTDFAYDGNQSRTKER